MANKIIGTLKYSKTALQRGHHLGRAEGRSEPHHRTDVPGQARGHGQPGRVLRHAEGDGGDSSEDFTTSLIKAVVPRIALSKGIWGSMRDKVDFELMPSRKLQAQARKEMGQNIDEAIGGGSGSGSGSGDNGGQADPGDVTP